MADGEPLIALTMPKWGMSMEKGRVVGWLVDEGTEIRKGDELVEIETEKIVNTVESSVDGTLARTVVTAGDELPVGALLGVIAPEAVAPAAIDGFVARFQESFVPEESSEDEAAEVLQVAVDGSNIAYRRIEAAKNDGIPLLLLHGFGGDQNSWLFNLDSLSAGHTVLVPDLPGHGASSKEVGDGSLDSLARTILDFLDRIGEEQVHVVGHSLGAAVGAQMATLAAGRVRSLTLIGSIGPGTEVKREFIEGFIEANRRKEMKRVLENLFADPGLVKRDMVEGVLKAKRIEGTEQCLRRIADASIEGDLAAPATGWLERLDIPVQVIWGREDRVAPVAQAGALPASVKATVSDGAGHMVHMEAAGTVNRLIEGLLKQATG